MVQKLQIVIFKLDTSQSLNRINYITGCTPTTVVFNCLGLFLAARTETLRARTTQFPFSTSLVDVAHSYYKLFFVAFMYGEN